MPKITFSHQYPKLETVMAMKEPKAQLVLVQPLELSQLPAVFVDYDTGGGMYPLPKKGAFMLLLFRCGAMCFPTLRRWTPNKHAYYSQLIGQEFDVVIEDPQEDR